MIKKDSAFNSFTTPLKMAGGNPNSTSLNVPDLPAVPVDKIISFLSAEDLRAFHQVSKSWKDALEKRSRDNERRLELVERIRKNKENIIGRRNSQDPTPASVAHHRVVRERSLYLDGKKCEASPVFMECTNVLDSTPNSSLYASTPDCRKFQTPNSRFEFQVFQEAEKSLEPGQKLFQCRRCRGPVPSPPVRTGGATPTPESRRTVTVPESTRCRLTSRMSISQSPRSPQKRETKKMKTLSSVDLSPIPFTPPVTVASLGEKITQSLFLSSPCLTTTSNVSHLELPGERSSDQDIRRSTSCSSIISGIDLPEDRSRERSSINISLDFNQSSLHSPAQLSSISAGDANRFPLSCSRSCCGHLERQSYHTSRCSDSNLSFDSELTEPETYKFAHMVPSPLPLISSHFESLPSYHDVERGRNIQDFSSSDVALSVSSFQFQRSLQNNSSTNDNFNSECNPVLECPNPQCGHRFCSGCEESEHPGKPCHVLSSDNFELANSNSDIPLEGSLSIGGATSLSSSSAAVVNNNSTDRSSSSRDKSARKKKKKFLRRIAKGP